jgi:hypothetical protein
MNARDLGSRITLMVATLVVAHLPFWLFTQVWVIERAQINVDLLIALAVFAWRPVLGLPALVLCWAIDGVVSQSSAFHFPSPAAFLGSMRFAADLRLTGFASFESVLCLSVFAAAAWGCWRMALMRRPEWLLSLACIGVVGVLDQLNGSSRYSQVDQRMVPMNIAGSPLVTLSQKVVAANETPVALGAGQSIADVAELAYWARTRPEGGIWLVLVESMGWPEDIGLRQQLARSLDGAAADGGYRIEQLKMPFKGSTTYGELRAMCGVIGSYADLSAAQIANCLPTQLASQGWTATGLHGFTGRMFDRYDWWPQIGLQKVLFLEDLNKLPQCGGAFRGVCDEDLLQESSRRLAQPRQFVYTLTLNTHLPLDPVTVPPDWQAACERANAAIAVCELLAAQSKLLAKVAALARELPVPRPLVVIVGDHAPPFLNARARGAFSTGVVPAFILRPE